MAEREIVGYWNLIFKQISFLLANSYIHNGTAVEVVQGTL